MKNIRTLTQCFCYFGFQILPARYASYCKRAHFAALYLEKLPTLEYDQDGLHRLAVRWGVNVLFPFHAQNY